MAENTKTFTVVVNLDDRRGPKRHDKDIWIDFARFNAAVVPKDRNFGTTDTHASEPDWEQGIVLQDRNTGREVTFTDPRTGQEVPAFNITGDPGEFFKACWRESNRQVEGVIKGADYAEH